MRKAIDFVAMVVFIIFTAAAILVFFGIVTWQVWLEFLQPIMDTPAHAAGVIATSAVVGLLARGAYLLNPGE